MKHSKLFKKQNKNLQTYLKFHEAEILSNLIDLNAKIKRKSYRATTSTKRPVISRILHKIYPEKRCRVFMKS